MSAATAERFVSKFDKVLVQKPRRKTISPGLPRNTPAPEPLKLGTTAFLNLDPESAGLRASLSEDIRLLDRLLGQVLSNPEDEVVIRVAHQLYRPWEAAEGAEGAPTEWRGERRQRSGAAQQKKREENPGEIFRQFPELRDPVVMRKVLRAFTVLFQVLNVAEQKEIVRANRERLAGAGDAPRPESIAEAVSRLAAQGLSAAQMQELLDRIEICPTITAHPTEARRRAVMDKLLDIADGLAQRTIPAELFQLNLPLDMAQLMESGLLRRMTALWTTDELRATPVRVQNEVQNAVYFFQRTILDVVTWLHRDMKSALARFYPGVAFRIPPFLRYHSWVGGDRDGNPNVTPEITWATVLEHKRVMLAHYEERLSHLRRKLSLSSRLVPTGEALEASLAHDREMVPLSAEQAEMYALQPYALKCSFMIERVRATMRHLAALTDFRAESPDFVAQAPAYADSAEMLQDLLLIQESLRAGRGAVLAEQGSLARLIVQVQSFGFHMASLDVRQHSNEHAKAYDEILEAAEVVRPGKKYSELPEAEKVRILTAELRSARPLLPRDFQGSEMVQRAIEVFTVIRHARRYVSRESVTCYVISMTHQVSDILEVLVLAKEAGLLRWVHGEDGQRRLESEIDVVPLFETIEDLQGCDRLLRELFAEETYNLHLAARGRYQEIMLGYSDSSKDGGYLAANWNLQDTQARLSAACRRHRLDFRFFHGRGGTVGRGGGRASRAILSQPLGSFTGRIRFTEQGEVVSFRYALRPMAHRHLEQIVNSVLVATAREPVGLGFGIAVGGAGTKAEPARFREAMAQMAAHSREVYRALVHNAPEFWHFYTQATPIAHISRLPITSRPTMRSGGALTALDDLRAIPWVFAWVQSRYVVPGWYGVGSGLESFAGRGGRRGGGENLALLQKMYREWPFFKTVIDNAQLELLRANFATAKLYAALVKPARLRDKFHGALVAEYERSRELVLAVTGQDELMQNAPVVKSTVGLRNPALLPLNRLQVALLDLWAREKQAALGAQSEWHDAVLLSITGIAAGMQSTG